jgi:hypothetical protein
MAWQALKEAYDSAFLKPLNDKIVMFPSSNCLN